MSNIQISDSISTAIIKNIKEFKECKAQGTKLRAVRFLKDLTGCSLREGKDALDLYWEDENYFIKKERLRKLEILSKDTLVKDIIVKMRNIDDDYIYSTLMKLPIDNIYFIDEIFSN
jgi:hypothetical protein